MAKPSGDSLPPVAAAAAEMFNSAVDKLVIQNLMKTQDLPSLAGITLASNDASNSVPANKPSGPSIQI